MERSSHAFHQSRPQHQVNSLTAIVAEAPDAIDMVHARHGETLRYFGLPFARVRSLLGHERVWFGIDRSHRRLLDESTLNDWHNLLSDLREHSRRRRSIIVMRFIAPHRKHGSSRCCVETSRNSIRV